MKIDSAVFVFAGLMVLISVVLTQVVSPWFGLLSVFIGLNLLQAGITGLCPAAWLFRKLGLKPGCTFE
jgi:hypothetical protein